MTKVGAIILAAGRSSRMGRNKMLEPVNGKAMLLHVVEAVAEAGLAGPIIALGHEADKVRASLQSHEHIPVTIPDYQEGLSRSLRGSVSAIPNDWDAVFICLGDMPYVSAAHLQSMAKLAQSDGIVVPMAGGKRGNPILWGRDYFEEMKTCEGDSGAKLLLSRHENSVISYDTTDDAVHRDIDSPADLAAGKRVART